MTNWLSNLASRWCEVRGRTVVAVTWLRGSLAHLLALMARRLSQLATRVVPPEFKGSLYVGKHLDDAVAQTAEAIADAEYWKGAYAALVTEVVAAARPPEPRRLEEALAEIQAAARAASWNGANGNGA